jgi:glyoxylase I family protein
MRDSGNQAKTSESEASTSVEVIGIDHIYIAVADLDRSEKFYDVAMSVLGFKKNTFINEADRHVQYFNRHFGFVLRPALEGSARHNPLAPGLHHFCFRVEDVSTLNFIARQFAERGIECSEPELYSEYAPDYYALFFTDPNGIRLEITNYREERRRRFAAWPNVS